MPHQKIIKQSTRAAVVMAFVAVHLVTAEEPSSGTKLLAPWPATIADIAWIAGHWTGEAMGGTFEETWNPPLGNSMVGMFKFAKDGKANFYELLTIVEENKSLVLRLKHFDPKLAGWEEKDKALEFPLLQLSETEATFDGFVFRKIDGSTMHILVQKKDTDGSVGELKFVGRRAEPK